jgi:Tol biopolymer transport system component
VRHAFGGAIPSPNGATLATAGRTSDGRIVPLLVSPDGSGERLLSDADPTLGLSPVGWSPDGTRLVLEGFDDQDRTRSGVYTMTSEGIDLRRVTSPGLRRDWPVGDRTSSPDGQHLLLMRSIAPVDSPDVAMDLFVVAIDGSGLVQLNPLGTTTALYELGATADWSPDGSRVAFIAAEGDYWSPTPRRAVFVASSDGTQAVQVTDWSDPLTVDWSPDGELLAMSIGYPWQIYTMHPDGSELRAVTTLDAGYWSQNPVWSPDSRRLLLLRTKGGSAESLWVANADGTEPRQVAEMTTDGFLHYAWMPR